MNVSLRGLHHKTFNAHLDKMLHAVEAAAAASENESAAVIRNLYKDFMNPAGDIDVIFDRTWKARGHDFHVNVGCIVELYTGLVIDYKVVLNFCLGCMVGPKPDKESFEGWQERHKCQKNSDCKAGRMQVEETLTMFRRSLAKHELRSQKKGQHRLHRANKVHSESEKTVRSLAKKHTRDKDQDYSPGLLRDLKRCSSTSGACISVRRLLQKVSKREVVRYRSLTDAPVCPEEMAEEQEEEEADEEMEEEAQGVEEKSELDLEELALGNKSLLLNLEVVNTEETDKAGGATGAAPMEVTSGGPATSNMVFHEGAILDVAKLLRQVERSERARTSSETRLKEVMEALAEVRESWDVSRQGAQRTQLELDQARRQLTAAEEELAGARKTAQELRLTLQNCRQHLQATLGSLDTVLGRKVEVVKKEPLDN
ncbi:hypothetical protein HPB47_024372 [Ixodes persulcatus]|uniref:Uncharacterized protein n=1 Tax=Ixodes persulcatus TaxID=34615 RepID=A0AC60Q6S4_IXOPE|nr:hypothetical protein HPB47_024372 [Ixodes persulcatus]